MKKMTLLLFIFICVGVNAQIITTVCGNGIQGYSGDGGLAINAEINWTGLVALDDLGNVFFCDMYNSRIRKIRVKTGIISTVAGNGVDGYSGDGGPADSAKLSRPTGIVLDKKGNIYFSDGINCCVRKVDITTGIISNIAGNGTAAFSGDGGPATSASLYAPYGLAFDSAGNLYIADLSNQRIRKVNAKTGIITTVAGNGVFAYSGDGGQARFAALNDPVDVVFDKQWNMYIADMFNDRIRSVDAKTQVITTVAGDGTNSGSGGGAYGGDGGPATSAQLWTPLQLAYDSTGNNLFIADGGNNRVRKLNLSSDTMTTMVGNGTAGFSGDGGLALNAELNGPVGLALDTSKNMYILDWNNFRIREVLYILGINEINTSDGLLVYPNPSIGIFNLQLGIRNQKSNIEVYNELGQAVFSKFSILNSQFSIDLRNQPSGIYLYRVITEQGELIGTGKLVIN